MLFSHIGKDDESVKLLPRWVSYTKPFVEKRNFLCKYFGTYLVYTRILSKHDPSIGQRRCKTAYLPAYILKHHIACTWFPVVLCMGVACMPNFVWSSVLFQGSIWGNVREPKPKFQHILLSALNEISDIMYCSLKSEVMVSSPIVWFFIRSFPAIPAIQSFNTAQER